MKFKFLPVIVLIIILLSFSFEIPVQGSRPAHFFSQKAYPIGVSDSSLTLDDSELYPIAEDSHLLPTPNAPFTYNPALVTENTIGVLLSGELINRNEEIESFKLESMTTDGLIEVPPYIPAGKSVITFPESINVNSPGGLISLEWTKWFSCVGTGASNMSAMCYRKP